MPKGLTYGAPTPESSRTRSTELPRRHSSKCRANVQPLCPCDTGYLLVPSHLQSNRQWRDPKPERWNGLSKPYQRKPLLDVGEKSVFGELAILNTLKTEESWDSFCSRDAEPACVGIIPDVRHVDFKCFDPRMVCR